MQDNLDRWLGKYASVRLLDDSFWQFSVWDQVWQGQVPLFQQFRVPRDIDLPAGVEIEDECTILPGHDRQLQPFGLEHGFFVRDHYWKIARNIVNAVRASKNEEKSQEGNPFVGETLKVANILLTGSRGTGKSAFLHFLLCLRLQAHKPTLFQEDSENCCLFTEKGVHWIKLPGDLQGACKLRRLIPEGWCLTDSTPLSSMPERYIRKTGLTILHSSSPGKDKVHWSRAALSLRFYMPPFTLQELIMARGLQVEENRPAEMPLCVWCQKYTSSAQLAYKWAHNSREYDKNLDIKLGAISGHGLAYLFQQILSAGDENLTDHIFVLQPEDNYRHYSPVIPTPYLQYKVSRHLCASLTTKQRTEAHNLYLRSKGMAPLAGYLMEHNVDELLSHGGTWKMSPLLRVYHPEGFEEWALSEEATSTCWLHASNSGFEVMEEAVDNSTGHPVDVDKKLSVLSYGDEEVDEGWSRGDFKDNLIYTPIQPNSGERAFDSFLCQGSTVYFIRYAFPGRECIIGAGGVKRFRDLGFRRMYFIGVVLMKAPEAFKVSKKIADEYEGRFCMCWDPETDLPSK